MNLKTVREALKADLENATFLGGQMLEIWINEAEHGDRTDTAWDNCVKQALECDLFIALYDGDAGWEPPKGGLGICHAEFDAAFNAAPQKVQVVRLPKNKLTQNEASQRFLDALTLASRMETRVMGDWPELKAKLNDLIQKMILEAALEGTRQFAKSGANVGQALAWRNMDFGGRSAAIRQTLKASVESGGQKVASLDTQAVREIDGESILFICHGVPRPLSQAVAREALGKPFLTDHLLVSGDKSLIGPVHLVGCPTGATENQAITFLGAPDVTAVPGSFGIFAIDRINMVQVALLSNCADAGSTRNAVVRLFEWLGRSGEAKQLIRRAKSRRRILEAIAQEVGS